MLNLGRTINRAKLIYELVHLDDHIDWRNYFCKNGLTKQDVASDYKNLIIKDRARQLNDESIKLVNESKLDEALIKFNEALKKITVIDFLKELPDTSTHDMSIAPKEEWAADFDKSVKSVPNSDLYGMILNNMGYALQKKGNEKEAFEYYIKALVLLGKHNEILMSNIDSLGSFIEKTEAFKAYLKRKKLESA